MNDFGIFKRFNSKEQANEIAAVFESMGIECMLVDDSQSVTVTFTAVPIIEGEIQLMIKQSDFELANKLMDDTAEESLTRINEDHYLFKFTNDELLEILTKRDEWNPIDYKLAQKILRDRGQNIDENLLASLNKDRIAELSKPDKSQTSWIIIGYVFAVSGGFVGMIIGWCLWTMKRTLPTGNKVPIYTEVDRRHGKRIFFIGAVVFPIALFIKISEELNL